MLNHLQNAVKFRAVLLLLLAHAGLALAIFGHVTAFPFALLAGIAALYLSVLLGALFVLRSLARARHATYWIEELQRDMPMILEGVPKVVAMAHELRVAWERGKKEVHHHERIRKVE